jgi:amidase
MPVETVTPDAVDIAERVRAGELRAGEPAELALQRIRKLNPAINAVIDTWPEDADAQLRDGVPLGLLAGVPMLLKDTIEFPGKRFAMGSRLRLDMLGVREDPWLTAMRAEGAVFLGKTNTPEFGLMDVTEPLAFGPTLNPWRRDLSVGGSSGGSAAAVAAGLVPIAHGSDGGGSIRFPASCCGVFGFKPTRGRTGPLLPTFDPRLPSTVVGHVLTRSVRDSALAFAIADSAHQGRPDQAMHRWVRQPIKRRLKVALISLPLHGHALANAHLQAVEQAAGLLQELGHQVQPLAWPFDAPAFHEAFFDRWAFGVHAQMQTLSQPERARFESEVEPWTLGLARHASRLSAARMEAVVQQCLLAEARMVEFHAEWDVLLTPVAAAHPLLLGQHAPDVEFAQLLDSVKHNVAFTPLQNVSGQPAMSVPLHWTGEGLPIGVHLAAAHGQDETLFELAYQLEAARPWGWRRPPETTANAS